MIRVLLRGGIGNQLFQYQAAKILSIKTSLNFEFLPQQRRIPHNHITPVELGISDFKVQQGGFRTLDKLYKKLFRKKDFGFQISEEVALNSTIYKESISKLDFRNFLQLIEPTTKQYILDGYFQDIDIHNIAVSIGVEIRNFSPRINSLILDNFLESLKQKQVFGLHIRRGDYVKYKDQIGILSERFYIQGLQELGATRNDRLIVFTNAKMSDLKNEFAALFKKFPNWEMAPELQNDALTLIAMSHIPNLIIANSTFSWWGAYSGVQKNVVAPSTFFRNGQKNSPSPLKQWTKIQSNWV